MSLATTLDWRAQALQDRLSAELPGLTVEALDSVDSTNTRLLEECAASVVQQFDAKLLVAEQQLRGRGRHGRSWQGERGASLTFSLALPLHCTDLSGLSLAVGVALADALDDAAAPRLMLKWPNDLCLVDPLHDSGQARVGRKLGGVLIETLSRGAQRIVVIGVGLNVLPLVVSEPGSGVAWLQEIDARASAPNTLHRIAAPLVRILRRFERDGFAAFQQRYQVRDLLFGQAVIAGDLRGVAQGVTSSGALLLRSDAGPAARLHQIVSGEVSVRLQPRADANPGLQAALPRAAC
jgi:BirA family biotin operon repressor/biotin-[acetyl-CoA-carboxylase] ligase